MAPTVKWNEQLNSKFIKLYREQECLWKTDDSNYRDKFCRGRAIKHIVSRVAIPELNPTEVKRRIKSLRATFMISLKRIMESKQSEDGKVYQPTLSWFHEMASFIKYDDETILGSGKPKFKHEKTTSEHEADNADDCDETKEAIYFIEQSGDLETEDEAPTTSNLTTRRRARRENDVNPRKRTSSLQGNDEFHVFGTHVAFQLRLLSSEQAIIAQEKIQSVLTKCRLLDLGTIKENKKRRERNDSLKDEYTDVSEESFGNDDLPKEKKYF